MNLADYGLSTERGFLAGFEPAAVTLPAELQPAREMALRLPELIPTGHLRSFLETLAKLDPAAFCASASDAELRIAMLHYSFLVQAYVWG